MPSSRPHAPIPHHRQHQLTADQKESAHRLRAYTDCIAQALVGAEKTPIVRLTTLRCAMPYALEGMARRELQAAGGTLGQVQHTAQVEMTFTLPEPAAASLVARLNEAGHGQMCWHEVDETDEVLVVWALSRKFGPVQFSLYAVIAIELIATCAISTWATGPKSTQIQVPESTIPLPSAAQ